MNDITLVIANPGTGKTTTISNEVVDLLESGTDPHSILCITFTNKAVEQIRSGINKRILERKLKNLTAYDVDIYTFHGYAYQALSDIKNIDNIISFNLARYLIYRKLYEIHALNYSRDYIINEIVPKMENAIRYIKSFGIKPGDIKQNENKIIEELKSMHRAKSIRNIDSEEEIYLFKYFYEAFSYYEEKKPYPDYNDLLFDFYGIEAKKYDYVFVDELQDVNDIEARIALSTGKIKFLVGDRKQSIFGFQGGALSVFNSLANSGNTIKKELVKNYRSTDMIIDYSKEYYIEHETNVHELENFSGVKGTGEKIDIIESDSPENSIINILNEIDTKKGTTCIIARTNSQIEEISGILDSFNITYTSDSNIHSVNESKKDIVSFFKGIIYDDRDSLIQAMITPFSGLSLKDAFHQAELINNENNIIDIFSSDNTLYKLKNEKINKSSILKIFDEYILPIAASISRQYFLTAASVKSSISEFFDSIKDYTAEKFFDYLELTYSENSDSSGDHGIILTTVHKAKGREFNNVIYVPKKPRKSDKYIDIITSSIIESVKGVNVETELEKEDIRVDFVAMTRAEDRLIILVDHKSAGQYYIEKYCNIKTVETENKLNVPTSQNYDEAYFLFASGNYEGAMELLKHRENWLKDLINKFFQNKKVLSFSLISLDNPFWLLKNNILKLNEKTDALYYGLNAHELAESYYKEEVDRTLLKEEEKKVLSNIESVINEIKSTFNMEQIESEVSAICPVNQMFDEFKDEDSSIMFYGKLDAVFGNNSGERLILDYKTDKTIDNSSHHRIQLLAYKILYSRKFNVNPDKIKIAIGYISLRNKINTGKNDPGIIYKQPDSRSEEKLKFYINRFLDYRKNPDNFIRDYLNFDCDDTLYLRLAELLK